MQFMNAAQLAELITQGEGARVEFKISFQKEVIETFCAYANTLCGAVLIGVSDAGRAVGVSIQPDKPNSRLQRNQLTAQACRKI
jgi:ATP-dependent DNA helicase RecG